MKEKNKKKKNYFKALQLKVFFPFLNLSGEFKNLEN